MTDIVVIGGANIDIKAKALDRNLLGTSNPGVVTTSSGGVGRNIAHNLARLGAQVALISCVGPDAHGEALRETTRQAGVDISRVAIGGVATGSYVVLIDEDGEMITAINDMRAVDHIGPDLVMQHEAAIASARYVVADCNLRQDTLRAIAEIARERLVIEPVSVPKSAKLLDSMTVGPVFLASPNFDQMEHLSGTRDIAQAFAFLHGKGLRNAVIHAGAEGAFVSNGKNIDHVAAKPPPTIVDVTGAGDAAVAGLVHGLLLGEDLFAAAARGQACAGHVIASTTSTL